MPKVIKTIKLTVFFILLVIAQFDAYSQVKSHTSISTIHPIELIKNHYKDISLLSPQKREAYSWMDTILYPPEDYIAFTLVHALNAPHYLTSSQVEFIVNSVEFPANSSKQTRAELDFLLTLQKERTAEQTERVMKIADIGYWPSSNYTKTHPRYKENLEELFFMTKEVFNEKYSATNYPKTAKLLTGVMNDTRLIEFAIKFNLLRVRPYHLDSSITPLSEIPTPSFASGHTLWAYSIAYSMSELIPEKRNEYLELAYEIGLSREIMGVHFPSDEEMARQVAHTMMMLMWHTDKFQKDFAEAKSEWEGK